MESPNRVFMEVDASSRELRYMANTAATYARRESPKLTGSASNAIQPYWTSSSFGVTWAAEYLWYQDQGTRPRVMRQLAGKLIPMWVNDADGQERSSNPKAKTRTTADGRTQVLIFRRAAPIGSRKIIKRKISGGILKEVSVPRSYPGAPGRIVTRELLAPLTSTGKKAGQIARGNVGLRWYFPGTPGRFFLERAVVTVAVDNGYSGPLKAGYAQIGLPDLVLG